MAWDVLGEVRDLVAGEEKFLAPDRYRQAMDAIYAAEGSDWFWWYGDDFVTDDDVVFDELFRGHLAHACRLADVPMPAALHAPICRLEKPVVVQEPVGLIRPTLDGRVTSYYEWLGAGRHGAERASTMHQGGRLVEAVWYGFDEESLYLRVDFSQRGVWPSGVGLRLLLTGAGVKELLVSRRGDGDPVEVKSGIAVLCPVAFDHVLELQIPHTASGWNGGQDGSWVVEVLRNGVLNQRLPVRASVAVRVPEASIADEEWSA